MTWLKTLLISVFILLAAAGALALMYKSQDIETFSKPDEPVWDVRTETLSIGRYRPQIRLIGQIEPAQDLIEVAMLAAKVQQVFFSDGMTVHAGDLIVQLDDFDARLQLQQTQADLADINARRTLQRSQQQLDKEALKVEKANLSLLQKQLEKQRVIANTQSAIDDLNQQIQRQQFAVLQRQAAIANHKVNNTQLDIAEQKLNIALKSAQRTLERTAIRAPFSGKLAQVSVSPGQLVNAGQPLFRLYSQDQMNVQVQLPTRLLPTHQLLTGEATDQQRTSKLTFVRSEAQLTAGQTGFKTWFQLNDGAFWLPGEVAYLTLNLAPVDNALQIPAAAVFQDKWIYRVDEEQRLQAVEVSVLGAIQKDNESYLVTRPHQSFDSDLRLLTTRLNNPTTGMKIYEAGVDPEPIAEEDTTESTDENAEVSDEDAE